MLLLSLVLRYVFNNEVKEVFVDFIEVMSQVYLKLVEEKQAVFVRHAWSVLRWRFQHVWCSFWLQSYCSAICPISNVLSLCLTSTKLGGYFSLHNAGVQKCSLTSKKLPTSSTIQLKGNVYWKCIDKLNSTPRGKRLKDACKTR